MTTKEEEPKEIQEGENLNQEEEEEKEEEEPVDLELQKEMKGLNISDKDFAKEPKTKKTQKKPKDPTIKKSKKKGQDFLDYANQNNIQINLEYEENKYQLKKTEDPKLGEKSGKYNDNKRPYNKKYQNKNFPQKKMKMSGNKFDMVGMRQYPNYNNSQNTIQLNDDTKILEHLEKIFSEENLNKDLYIRNRIKDGKILLDNVVNYYDFKNNKIEEKKIIDLVKNSKNLEIVNEEGKNYIKIKDFDETKIKTGEQIYEMRKNQRVQKNQYNNGGMQYLPPYYNFQNNVIIYNNGLPYPNYYQYQMPPQYMYQENK